MSWKKVFGNWKHLLATSTLAIAFIVPSAGVGLAPPPQLFQGPGAHGRVYNGTGRATGAPIALEVGENTVTVTALGTFNIVLPVGYSATAATGTTTVTSSPVSCDIGSTTITTTGVTGTITVTVTALWPTMAGVYECRGNVSRFELDGTRDSYKQSVAIMVNTQADSVISNADIYIGNDITPTWADVTGFVGTGAYPRMTLYLDSGEGAGYPVVVNCIVKLNRDGTPKSIQGTIDGLYDDTADLQVAGSFKGNWAALV